MDIKNMEKPMWKLLFLITLPLTISFSTLADTFDAIPIRVLSWSVNDGIVIVEHGNTLVVVREGGLLEGTPYQLRSIQQDFVTFFGDKEIGEVLRIYPQVGTEKQKIQRTSILPTPR